MTNPPMTLAEAIAEIERWRDEQRALARECAETGSPAGVYCSVRVEVLEGVLELLGRVR